jgi:hypothetical protein
MSRKLLLGGTVNGKECDWLVDTGADVSVIDVSLLPQGVELQPSPVKVHGFMGTAIPSLGIASVDLTAGPYSARHDVMVFDGFKPKALLGMDILNAAKAVVDIHTREIRMRGRAVSLQICTIDSSVAQYALFDDTTRADPTVDRQQVRALVERFDRLMKRKRGNEPANVEPLRIQLLPQAVPQFRSMYRMTPAEEEFVEQKVQQLLDDGLIEEARGRWAASPTLAYNPGKSEPRFCIDYTPLNAVTIAEVFHMPTWADILSRLHGTRFISIIDIKSAYHQCPVNQKDRYKTGFSTRTGHYQWRVVPFGLKNAPAYFQRIMTLALRAIPGVSVFIDDIGIFSRTFEEHCQSLGRVFDRLEELNLQPSPSKCAFFMSEAKFLGVIVDREGVRPDPKKTAAVAEMTPPGDTTALKRFLGTAQWFSAHIKGLATLAAPLTELLRSGGSSIS